MNQEKIGKFILECRKNKKLTQSELAEKLGVTDKSI
ncbi:MAG: helix-turn-helix transcriptional regulator, partial [Bacilli bacterium]|nr:helix-turn-helix transcriptional regulator [Bacilli bacterium]